MKNFKKTLSLLLCTLMLLSAFTTVASAAFVDVKESDYYYDAVKWALEKGITTGTSDTTFSPKADCSRAQAVTFLWRAAGSPTPTLTKTNFTDINKDAYYYTAVLWALENNITTGTSATTFAPTMKCSRAQIVTFLWRTMGAPVIDGPAPFTDVSIDAFYRNAVLWAVNNDITTGTGGGYFSPTKTCSRAQIVTFLYRCFNNEASELKIVVQPKDHYMRGSQEEVTFSITIEGGAPNYYYEWVVLYENGPYTTLHGATSDTEDEFTVEITDYDFDNFNSTKELIVYCNVTDIEGTEITSNRVSVYAKEHYPHLTVVSDLEDYYMKTSQEEATFTVEVDGGFAPYSYTWTVLCDGEVTYTENDLSDEKTNTFKHEFSDYDFDDYRDISVYCTIMDQHANSNAETVKTRHSAVWSKDTFRIAAQPQDHQMTSSQEDVTFTVKVGGGTAPYTYTWYAVYDNEEIAEIPSTTTVNSSTFTREFTDYDFDDYNNVGVYCVIKDAKGNTITSKIGNVIPK